MLDNEHCLDFNALILDIKSGGDSTAAFAQNVLRTQRRILNELEYNKDFYLKYAQVIAPPHLQDGDGLHDLVQDTILRALGHNDALDESQDIRLWLMSEMPACLEETPPQEESYNPDDLINERDKSPTELTHISRIRKALLSERKNLTPSEGVILGGLLSELFAPDDIPENLLHQMDLEKEDVLDIFNDIFDKLRSSKVLRDLHDNRNPDDPSPL